MTKLKNPLMSLKAQGRLSKLFSLAKRQGRHIIERRPIPVDAKSSAQLFNRHMFTKCRDLWHLLSEAEKQEWESLARPRHMTGYAWFVSQCLRPNPGIYLPLQGGTMSGNIDMDKNRLLKLPLPTDNQEPDTLAARIAAILAHKGVAAAHHARYTDGEAVTAAKTIKLDDFATPDDNTDLNASASRHGLFKKLDNIATHFLNGLGNWVAIAPGISSSHGTYTGNDTVNRPIAHGLGSTPTGVFISQRIYPECFRIFGAVAIIIRVTATAKLNAVTIPDATNFYVGNAASYFFSANKTGTVYDWIAIG